MSPHRKLVPLGEALALIESSTTMTLREVAEHFGVSRQAIDQVLRRGGYAYTALANERRAVKTESQRCKKAWLSQLRRAEQERSLAPCGTSAAYNRHLIRGEKPCTPCLDANADRVRAYSEQRRDRERPDRRRDSAETRATKQAAARRRFRGEAA